MENKPDNKPLFVIDNDPIVDWPVIVKLPVSGGTFEEHHFDVSMRVLSPDEYEQLFKDAPGNIKDGQDVPAMSAVIKLNAPIFQRLITGWNKVSDKDGNAVAYSPERLAEQISGPRGPALSLGIWRAISEVRYGARLGN
jgi:hypothetical protein